MDKRLILFVISLSAALFLVNFYFQRQHEEELRIWTEAQKARNEVKRKELLEEIEVNRVDLGKFPLLDLFADAEGAHFLGTGFSSNNKILYLEKNPSEVIFARKKGSQEPLHPFTITSISLPLDAHLYQAKDKEVSPLQVGELTDFGQFYLQLLSFHPLSAYPAHYTDGHFNLIEEELISLEEKKKGNGSPSGIVAMKIDEKWLPIGIYDGQKGELFRLEDWEGLESQMISPKGQILKTTSGKTEEQFFVLENNYMQLVFSNYGGALAEINLPFENEKRPGSVVKEVEVDRDILKNHPENAFFPAHSYFIPGEKQEGPFEKKPEGRLGGYYPLIRRDLIKEKGFDTTRISPRFYALNIVSEYPEVAELVYEVKSFTKNEIVFEAKQSHRKITKTFTLADEGLAGPYCLDLNLKIEGDSRGLYLTSGIPEVEWISGGPAPSLKYRITRNQKANVEVIDLPKETLTMTAINPDWLSNSNGFFGTILDPVKETSQGLRATYVSGTQVPSRLTLIDREYDLYPASTMPGYQLQMPLKTTPATTHYRIFAGPFATDILKQVDAIYSNKETGYNPDYIASQTFHGWFSFISEPFAKFLFFLMNWFYYLTSSWAFSIILLTIALRLMLYPLNTWSLKSTLQMQAIAPEVKAIQEKYKKEPQKGQIEIVNLYRERGVNPLSGCLPLLIQMPFLIGMFDLLKSTFELRGASFIPGWIDDLSAPDVLFSWHYPLFFIGNEFHLLPFILGGVMFLQQRMMAPSDVNEMTEQQRQQRSMGTIMTVVFTLMFYHFPSGLNIYWLSSMLLGMGQQWWTARQLKVKPVKTVITKK